LLLRLFDELSVLLFELGYLSACLINGDILGLC